MQEQFKYRYFIDGKEIDTREEYFNTTMSGDYVSYFDGDSVFSVSFNSFFGGQKEKQIEQRLKLAEYYKEKAIKEYELDTPLTKDSRGLNDHVKDTLDLGQIKGSSTRHKSQNGETHKDLTIEEKLKIAEGLKKEALKQLTITLDDIKTQSSPSYYTSPEKKEEIKADWIDFIGCGIKRGKTINYENSAEKENKTEENLVFQKDSEIHKEELPPFTTNYPDDYFKRLIDVYAGNGQKYYAVNDARSEGVNEGVKRNNEGVKESNGKTDYSEINLEILDIMAERFTANKHKYPQGNMKKPIDIKSLEWALFRHVKKMIQPIETDEETYKDHLSAVLCNASMILDQLKNQK